MKMHLFICAPHSPRPHVPFICTPVIILPVCQDNDVLKPIVQRMMQKLHSYKTLLYSSLAHVAKILHPMFPSHILTHVDVLSPYLTFPRHRLKIEKMKPSPALCTHCWSICLGASAQSPPRSDAAVGTRRNGYCAQTHSSCFR